MKVGDLVRYKRAKGEILGIVMRLFEINNLPMHNDPLLVADIMTDDGIRVWKRRKLEVVNENR